MTISLDTGPAIPVPFTASTMITVIPIIRIRRPRGVKTTQSTALCCSTSSYSGIVILIAVTYWKRIGTNIRGRAIHGKCQ